LPASTAWALGALGFSLVIGLLMHLRFRNEEGTRAAAPVELPEEGRPLYQTATFFGLLVGNGVGANPFASVVGAFMYFATLTEAPILQGLVGIGMGQGPALALLLAGPALSLPSMRVIRGIVGTRKTLAFVGLVVVMATLTGLIYGALVS